MESDLLYTIYNIHILININQLAVSAHISFHKTFLFHLKFHAGVFIFLLFLSNLGTILLV